MRRRGLFADLAVVVVKLKQLAGCGLRYVAPGTTAVFDIEISRHIFGVGNAHVGRALGRWNCVDHNLPIRPAHGQSFAIAIKCQSADGATDAGFADQLPGIQIPHPHQAIERRAGYQPAIVADRRLRGH